MLSSNFQDTGVVYIYQPSFQFFLVIFHIFELIHLIHERWHL